MKTYTTANDIIRSMMETLRESARESLPNATEAEREASIANFLGVLSDAKFNAMYPSKK